MPARALPSTSLLALSTLLSACITPTVEVAGSGSPLPEAPHPEAYQCTVGPGGACALPLARVWMPGWMVTEMAARGQKAAFVAYPPLPEGGANLGEPPSAGQIDLETGHVDWIVPLGAYHDDFRITYDLAIAPNGFVLVGGLGYGETLLGEKVGQDDGVFVVFDSAGTKRFARRLEIWDEPPPASERPSLIHLQIFTHEAISIQTAFHLTKPNQPTIAPVHLFSYAFDGTQQFRKEVPIQAGSFNGSGFGASDGSMWVKTFPGPFRRYDKNGDVLTSFELPADADLRGFAPIAPETLLVTLTTKGSTNELYRFDSEGVLSPLFKEPAWSGFHAAEVVNSINFERTYLAAWELSGANRALCTVDAQGHRGPVTKVSGTSGRFEAIEGNRAVFFRHEGNGTEWIVLAIP